MALRKGFEFRLGVRSDLEAWAVGMGPNDLKACVSRVERLPYMKSYKGRVVSGEKVL